MKRAVALETAAMEAVGKCIAVGKCCAFGAEPGNTAAVNAGRTALENTAQPVNIEQLVDAAEPAVLVFGLESIAQPAYSAAVAADKIGPENAAGLGGIVLAADRAEFENTAGLAADTVGVMLGDTVHFAGIAELVDTAAAGIAELGDDVGLSDTSEGVGSNESAGPVAAIELP